MTQSPSSLPLALDEQGLELTYDEVERFILKTEPATLSDGGDKIWTRRMAVALADEFNSRLVGAAPDYAALLRENEELAKRTDELTGCREALKQSRIEVAKLEQIRHDLNEMVLRYLAKAEAAEARARRMEKALRPFSSAVDGLSKNTGDFAVVWGGPPSTKITAGDLRRARAALSDSPAPAKPDGAVNAELLAALPMPVSLPEVYAPFLPTANAIVDEYLRKAAEIRDETQNTDIWGVAEEVLRIRIAEAIALSAPSPREGWVTEAKSLERGDGRGGWTVHTDVLKEIQKAAGEWAEEAYLETVQAIALAVEARILAAPSPQGREESICAACRGTGTEQEPYQNGENCLICHGTGVAAPHGMEAQIEEKAHAIAVQLATSGKSGRVHQMAYDAAKAGAKAALSAAPSQQGREGPTHRHKKRGSEYTLIGIGKMQVEDWVAPNPHGRLKFSVDMREVAIYRSVDDGSLWVRPREEFEDGRFEALAAPHGTKEGR